MGKVLKSTQNPGPYAYLEKTFGDHDEVTVTFRLAFTAAALALWETDDSGALVQLLDETGDFDEGFELLAPTLVWTSDRAGGSSSATPAPVAERWHDVQLHWNRGAVVQVVIDGHTLWADAADDTPAGVLHIGLVGGATGADAAAYYDDVVVTIPGGTVVFSDDFESGDLSAWDSVVGDGDALLVVDDPGFADPDTGGDASSPRGVCIAFDDAALEPNPVWTRLDDPDGINVVSGWTIDRGRTSELEKTGTGTAEVTMIDTTGLLDPTNPGSPLAGKLNPMKQAAIALQNPVSGEWSTLIRGFVSDWDWELDVSEQFATITLSIVDAFDLFASRKMTPDVFGDPIPSDDTGPDGPEGDIFFADDPALDAVQTRANGALDDFGWPAGLREIFTGNVGLQRNTYPAVAALLEVLQDAADAEFPGGVSNVFMRKDGAVVFHGRLARFNPDDVDYDITRWRVGDQPAFDDDDRNAVISGLQFSRSRDKIINVALVLPQAPPSDSPGLALEEVIGNIVKDTDSIAEFGHCTLDIEDLLTRNGDGTTALEETKKFAQYYVDNYKQPRTRVDRIRFRPQAANWPEAPRVWALMCGVDISDILALTTSHVGGGGFDEEDFFVEGLHYEARPLSKGMHEVTLDVDVSPAAYYDVNPFT
jgi:hypothetical protein